LLRRHRLSAGLTQEGLAERAGLSVSAIQKLENGSSHPYRDTARRLVLALQLNAEVLVAFQDAAQTPPRHRRDGNAVALGAGQGQLPSALTSFVGREREQAEIVHTLPTARLVTLTGVGGCGKTRLALQVAGAVSADYPDGVWLVELAPLTDPALVPQAVASALGIRESPTQSLAATIAVALRQRGMLLVLDNCEHLLTACAQLLDTLLRGCSELRVLATSREPIGLNGELNWRVQPLPVPPVEGVPGLDQIAEFDSVQLFVDRARAYSPGFALSEYNAATIARICQQLDGIPLALELAAALVPGLSADAIAARLEQRFALLTRGSRAAPARQQTLRATIDWSYELLSAVEQKLFNRLSVFAGQWTMEAAETVCRGGGIGQEQLLEPLLRLVDKSLVTVVEDQRGRHRYRLLDTLRQYGRERLHESGEAHAVSRRHASFYLTVVEEAEPELNGARQAECIERIALEHSELLAALDWLAAQREVQEALRLVGVLSRFWEVRGHLSASRDRIQAILDLPGAEAPTPARAMVLHGAAVLAMYQGDFPATRALLKESLALYRQHQLASGIAWVQIHFGLLCHEEGRLRAGRRFIREALAVCRQLDDVRGAAMCLNVLGLVEASDGHYRLGRSLHEESLALSRRIGDRWGTAWALTNLGMDLLVHIELGEADPWCINDVLDESEAIWRELGERRHLAFTHKYQGIAALYQGNFELARKRLEQSQTECTDLQDEPGMENILWSWSVLFEAQGQYEPAALVKGAAFAHASAKRPRFPALHRMRMERRLAALRDAIGPELLDTALAQGSTMSLDAALTYVQTEVARQSALASLV
jgi:non-specific serine/threonine protein kinase